MTGVNTEDTGWVFQHYDVVGSTNDIAKASALEGARSRTGFIARQQVGGRGRRARAWASPQGGLWMSLLLRPAMPLERFSLITLAAGVAVVRALNPLLNSVKATLKWPNDVQLNGKKVCGILCESSFDGNGERFVVVGIGVNLNVDMQLLPPDVRLIATSVLHETGRESNLETVAMGIARETDRVVLALESGEVSSLLTEWTALCPMLGKRVSVQSDQIVYTGVAGGLGEDGALLISPDAPAYPGEVRRVVAADVSVRLS